MTTTPESAYFNKSAYVALLCLIAFAVVITICVIKQCIWDPLLSKRFETIRPVLSASARRLSSFYRSPSSRASILSNPHSYSDICAATNDTPMLPPKNLVTGTNSLPSNGGSNPSKNYKILDHSYGSSSINSYSYTNYGSHDLEDDQLKTPSLYLSFHYNLIAKNVKITIQDLRHINAHNSTMNVNDYILIRFFLTTKRNDQSHETSPQRFQDCIRFGETFTILNNVHPTDVFDYEIKFSIVLITDGTMFEVAHATYLMKDDDLKNVQFVENMIPVHFKLAAKETK